MLQANRNSIKPMKSSNRFLVLTAGVLAALAVLAEKTPAATDNYTGNGSNTAGNRWFDTGAWSLGTVPTASDAVTISNNTTPFMDLANGNARALSLTISGSSGVRIFSMNSTTSNTLNVTGAITATSITVAQGNTSSSYNMIQAGSMNVTNLNFATNGWLTMGSGQAWTAGGVDLNVDNTGTSTFRINGGNLTATGGNAYGVMLARGASANATLYLDAGMLQATRIGIGRQQAGFENAGTGTIQWSGGMIRNQSGTDLLMNSYDITDNYGLQINLTGNGTRTFYADTGKTIRVGAASTNLSTGSTQNTSGAYLTGSNGTLVIDGGGTVELYQANSYNGTIQIKTGTMKLMSGNNTYNSVTANYNASISAGTVLLGSASTTGVLDVTQKTSGYTLSAAQNLQGSGTVRLANDTTALTLAGGLAPGVGSVGILSVEGDLALTSTTVATFEVNGFTAGTFDLVQGTGTGFDNLVTFGGTLDVLFTGIVAPGSVQIFGFDHFSGNFSTVNFSGLGSGMSASFDSLTGTVNVVPEPATWLLAALGLTAVVAFRRRRA